MRHVDVEDLVANAVPCTDQSAQPVTSLVELLMRRAEDSFMRRALVDPLGDRELTWGQLLAQALATAEQVEQAGLKRGDRVVHLGPHAADWIVVDLACLLTGVVQVALHADASPSEQNDQVRLFRPQGYLLSGGFSARLLEQDGLPKVSVRVVWPDTGQAAVDHDAVREQLAQRLAGCDPEAPATVLISSGTTGQPKGFIHSQQALATNAAAAAAGFLDEPDDVRLAWLPQSHALARVGDLYTTLMRGGCLSVVGDRRRLLEACRRLPPAVILGVPIFFDRLAAAVEAGQIPDLAAALGGRVRVCVSGGAPLRQRTVATFRRQKVPLVEGYGLAEAGPVVTVSNPRISRPGVSGLPLDGIELAIDQRPATRGQVLVRTPCRALAVIDPAMGRQSIPCVPNGWLETGDRGSLDADGQLRIAGRLDAVVPLATGVKVPSEEIEAALLEEPVVTQVCVVGAGLAWPVALIVPDPAIVRLQLKRLRCRVWSRRQAITNPKLLRWLARRLAARQQSLPRGWQVRRFRLVDHPFDAAHGEATESYKLKREAIAAHAAPLLQSLDNSPSSLPRGVGKITGPGAAALPQEIPMARLLSPSDHAWLTNAVWRQSGSRTVGQGFAIAAERARQLPPAAVTVVLERVLAAVADLQAAGQFYEPATDHAFVAAPLADPPAPPRGRISREAEVALAKTGLWGLMVPEQHGGSGCAFSDFTRGVTQLVRANPTVAGLVSVHSTIGAVSALTEFGTADQQNRWLPRLAAGRPLSVFAATEPDAGCDLGRVQCRLERDGHRLLLSGTKMFITGATHGRLVKLLALLEGTPTIVLVELPVTDTPNFKLHRYALHPLKHTHNTAIEFHRFPVDSADILEPPATPSGRERDGMAIVWHGLNRGRVTLASQAAGTIGLLTAQAAAFARQRQTWGEPIIRRELVLGRLGRMAAGRLACEALAGWAAAAIESGGTGELEAVLAKVVASNCLRQAATDALGIHGGRSFLVGHPLGDSFHDHFAAGVYEGESDLLGLALFKGVAKQHPLGTKRSAAGWLAWRLSRCWRDRLAAEDNSLLDPSLKRLAQQARHRLARWSFRVDGLLRQHGPRLAEQQLLVVDLSKQLQQLISCLAVVHLADQVGTDEALLAATCWSRHALAAERGRRLTAADHSRLADLGRLQAD